MRPRTPKTVFAVSLVLLLGVLFILSGKGYQTLQTAFLPDNPSTSPQVSGTESEKPAVQQDAFGINKALEPTQDQVQRGQTFADILTAQGVPYSRVAQIVEEARPVFDARHIRPGKSYRAYQKNDSLRYFVYQRDPVNYVVFDLADSLQVYEDRRSVDIVQKEVETVIEGSLYESLQEAGASPLLTFKLADVYAWQIDFFRIQKGDYVKAIYEERQIDGKPIGLGKVIAARFIHLGYDYYGYYFEQGPRSDYFDDRAENLRKAFLKSPLEYGRITSGYSKRRFHPVLKRYRSHLGTDYAAPKGTPIKSVGDGIVMEAERGRYNGNYVKIRHNATYTTQYLHMTEIAENVDPGERVFQGDVIGYVGETGLATGPHVCYRFWKNGRQVDPYEQKIPSAPPVDPMHLDRFKALKNRLRPRLQKEMGQEVVFSPRFQTRLPQLPVDNGSNLLSFRAAGDEARPSTGSPLPSSVSPRSVN